MNFDKNYEAYLDCVKDLLESPVVLSMRKYIQHSDVTCLEHCIFVSYITFLFSRKAGLDYRSAARGALLHDLFLYDWHNTHVSGGLHGFTHPITALNNANLNFKLNSIEQDVIKKHMWPLVLSLPLYKESFIVCLADKYCAIAEIFKFYQKMKIKRKAEFYKTLNITSLNTEL